MLRYQTLAYTRYGELQKSHLRTINSKYQLQRAMKNLNYLMVHILSHKLKTILSQINKKHRKITDNPVRMYVNKIENTITFKIKTGYYLELLLLKQ